MNLPHLISVVVDVVIAALALWALYWGSRWLLDTLREWQAHAPVETDPAAAAVWEVLDEARRITQGASDAAG